MLTIRIATYLIIASCTVILISSFMKWCDYWYYERVITRAVVKVKLAELSKYNARIEFLEKKLDQEPFSNIDSLKLVLAYEGFDTSLKNLHRLNKFENLCLKKRRIQLERKHHAR